MAQLRFGTLLDGVVLPDDLDIGTYASLTARSLGPTLLVADQRLLGAPEYVVEFRGTGFVYSGGVAVSGVLTGIRESLGGALVAELTDLSIPIVTFLDLVDADATPGFAEFAFAGSDVFLLTAGNDVAGGGSGDDLLYGLGGQDRLDGFFGNDTLIGGAGDDQLLGGPGDDLLAGGPGLNTLFGGAGADRAVVEAARRQADTAGSFASSVLVTGPDATDTLESVEAVEFVDGVEHFSPTSAAAQVLRLYRAALDREPDPFGLSGWTAALEAGALSLVQAAHGFVASAEFQQRFPALDAGGFVTLLYDQVLGRGPDAAGLSAWTAALTAGALTRAQVLAGFSESAEFVAQRGAETDAGLWVAKPAALTALTLYRAALDRLPDLAGLANWIAALEAGLPVQHAAEGFAGSAEFTLAYGALDQRGFVEQLYQNALDRPGDPSGIAAWAGALEAGLLSRGEVLAGFAQSAEMATLLTASAVDGVALL